MQMALLAESLAAKLGLVRLDVEAVVEAALLHDIGLYEMAPTYLSNPGPLSTEQRMDLWRHSILGEQAMAKRSASRHSQLLVRWHHEWWNGSGYPDMLSFEEIPIGARILHAVEMYSALIADRPYRPALDPGQAKEMLRGSAGVQCDPFVVRELLALLQESRFATAESAPSVTEAPSGEPGSVVQAIPGGELDQPLDLTGTEAVWPPQATPVQPAQPEIQNVVIRPANEQAGGTQDQPQPACEAIRGWGSSPYISGSLLGFQISVLRQIDFRCVAVPFCGWGELVRYVAALGKQVLSNDPRPWAALAGRAAIESEGLNDEQIFRVLQDTYIPGTGMSNPVLRRWFGEADAWWLDNLRRKAMDDPGLQDQTLLLGLRSGDYAQSFDETTRELKRPLTVIFRELAANTPARRVAHPYNRAYSQPVEQFLRDARADLMYLNLPAGQARFEGQLARSSWRDTWVIGYVPEITDDFSRLAILPQSKKAYLEMVDRILVTASRIRKWAVECRDIGLASARDISDLLKTHRPIQATYSKDLTEIPGGLRSYVMVCELA
jgi:hypothetical protein